MLPMTTIGFGGATSSLNGVFTDYYNFDEAANNANAHDYVGVHDLTEAGSPVRAAGFGSVPFCKTLVSATPKFYAAAGNDIFSCGDIDYAWVGWVNIAGSYASTFIFTAQGVTNGEYTFAATQVATVNVLIFKIFGGGGSGSQQIQTDDMSPTFGLWTWVYAEHSATNDTMRLYTRTPGIHTYDSGNIATTKTPAVDTSGNFGFGIGADLGFGPMNGLVASWGFKKNGVLTTPQLNAHYNSGNGVVAPF